MSNSYLFDNYTRYPIHIVLGDPGAGKTLFGTYLAWLANNEKIQIFCNYHLKGIPFHYLRYYEDYDEKGRPFMVNDILRGKAEDGTVIKNGLLIWDEPQSSGLESHSFFSKSTIEMSRFVSQIRKLDLALILITQRQNFPVYNVRQLVAFDFLIHPTKEKGIIDVIRIDDTTDTKIDKKPLRYNLRAFYDYYDTKERVGIKPEEITNDKNES